MTVVRPPREHACAVDVLIPLATLVLGFLLSALAEGRRDKRIERREQRARDHARELARDERLFRVRSETYRDALAAMHLRFRGVEKAHPKAGSHEPLPPPPSREEMAQLDSSIGAFGSEAVRAAVARFGDTVHGFRQEVARLESLESQGAPDEMYRAQFLRIVESRESALTLLRACEEVIRTELGGTGPSPAEHTTSAS